MKDMTTVLNKKIVNKETNEVRLVVKIDEENRKIFSVPASEPTAEPTGMAAASYDRRWRLCEEPAAEEQVTETATEPQTEETKAETPATESKAEPMKMSASTFLRARESTAERTAFALLPVQERIISNPASRRRRSSTDAHFA